MEENFLSSFYNDEKSNSLSVDRLKFWLMPFVFFVLLGFPTKYGSFVKICSNFAAPAFFILCGFFNLPQDMDVRMQKIKKALKRSAVFFLILFISYTAINIIYLAFYNNLNASLFEEIFRKRVIFNFLVLNIWVPLPMGSSIWFIHSLFYAYLFFFIAEKLNLSKLYLPLLILLYAVLLAVGEFSLILRFPYFGYDYIPANAFTRAIPYMLIGMYLRKHIDKLGKLPRYLYAIFFFVGLGLTIGEFTLLSHLKLLIYTNHAIGLGIMAVSVCCYALVAPTVDKRSFLANHGRNYARRLYALCQPVSLFVFIVGPFIYPPFILYYARYGSFIVFAVCFIISVTAGTMKHLILTSKKGKKKH